MQTIRIQVSDRIYKNLIESLNKFKGEDLNVLEEDELFKSNQKMAKQRLEKVVNGSAELLDFEEFERNLAKIV
ncbi:MAG: hypothetical protein ABJP45_13115 [Cyclobacteriaceae bacterium]